ncbi:MAG: DUF1611 domain-containing protein [Gammaproteobacteria bacterium]|nr:DUF1611 domain-containing protein [Gammaproteobacteria bacterium]
MLNPDQTIAILFDDQLGELNGKMGHGVLRYSPNPLTCVIDSRYDGKRLHDIVDFGDDCPVVGNVEAAANLGARVLILGMAPSGGRLPTHLKSEVDTAVANGMCVINGLHELMAQNYPELKPGQWVWDIRIEPAGINIARARAAALDNKRVVIVGTDMAIGKMTVGLEIWKLARERGIKSDFLATGQIGITIAGKGIPLDAIRVDYACGAVEQMVLDAADNDLVVIEGQGSLVHPGSTSNLPLIRGSCPTHFILCHRADADKLWAEDGDVAIPPLDQLIELYEDLSSVCGSYKRAKTVGVALNTYGMSEEQAQEHIELTKQITGLPVTDAVRYGADELLDAIMT